MVDRERNNIRLEESEVRRLGGDGAGGLDAVDELCCFVAAAVEVHNEAKALT